jgi:hypothetical protein
MAEGGIAILRHFIDQRMAGEWIAFAESTLKRLGGVEKVTASLAIQPSGNGWQIELNALNKKWDKVFLYLSWYFSYQT